MFVTEDTLARGRLFNLLSRTVRGFGQGRKEGRHEGALPLLQWARLSAWFENLVFEGVARGKHVPKKRPLIGFGDLRLGGNLSLAYCSSFLEGDFHA
jgi:hypothetical protein